MFGLISIISFIGISAYLLKYIPLSSCEIHLFSPSIRSVILANNSCNERDYTVFDFSRFNQVESIEIGNDCFGSVKTFKIEGLNQLQTIKIGNNSFTQDDDGDKSKSFHILNCESLESIEIGEYSFSDFGGEFELKIYPNYNLFKLVQLEMIHTISILVPLLFEVLK